MYIPERQAMARGIDGSSKKLDHEGIKCFQYFGFERNGLEIGGVVAP
jgi:hypothetical protein